MLAALHGLVLTATRISGLPVVVYPVLYAWLNQPREAGSRRNAARLATALAVAAFAALGAGLFFLYCQIHFGCWDLYMKTQLLGWGVRPDYFAFFNGDAYQLGVPFWIDGYIDPGWFSRFSSTSLLPAFAGFLVAEILWARSAPDTGWRKRAGIYLAAWLVYYLSVAGTSRLGLVSMSRYALVPEVLLVLCLIHMLSRRVGAAGRVPTWLRLLLAVWALFGFASQVGMHCPLHARPLGRLNRWMSASGRREPADLSHQPAHAGRSPADGNRPFPVRAPCIYSCATRDGAAGRRKSIPGREKRWPNRRGRSLASTPTSRRPAKRSLLICDCPSAISTRSRPPAAFPS